MNLSTHIIFCSLILCVNFQYTQASDKMPVISLDQIFFDSSMMSDCGSGATSLFLLSDHYGSAQFGKYCARHDQCYDNCSSTKSECDDLFISELEMECDIIYPNREYKIKSYLCMKLVSLFEYGTNHHAKSAYEDAREVGQCAINYSSEK